MCFSRFFRKSAITLFKNSQSGSIMKETSRDLLDLTKNGNTHNKTIGVLAYIGGAGNSLQ